MPALLRAAVAAAAVVTVGALLLLGCDTLFPEFSGKPVDASVADGSSPADGGDASPRLQGTVCILADLRDYRSCAPGTTGLLRITVEETREQSMTDLAGHFTLPLSAKLDVATVAVIDPQGNFAPTIVPVRTQNGVAANLALPIAAAPTLSSLALQNGLTNDPQRGTLVSWVVDATGAPVAGVTSNQTGALYDDAGPSGLSAGHATHAHGTVALFDVAPTTLTLVLTPPPTLALKSDTFTLPIRAGALTATTLYLPPR